MNRIFSRIRIESYPNGLEMSGVERCEIDGEGVFLEGIAIDLSEVSADGAARIVEENHHVPLPVQHAIHVLRRQNDLHNQRFMYIRDNTERVGSMGSKAR